MELPDNTYCNSLTNYSRFKTRTVIVGKYPLGSDYPIRIQSMTNTNTLDIVSTVEQSIRIIHCGCEYVRITASSMDEAKSLIEIKKKIRARGYDNPLIADIHFNPQVAEFIAPHIEKIRINPGNFADKKTFKQLEYSDTEYHEELDRIYNRFSPLVKICKENGTAMRVGVNHGSLSDRIMSRYGDTPTGMVEAALEFIRICESLNYQNLVLSMKASNVRVMVYAYRLLVNRMILLGMNYPLHLGVTEAGEGEDGRIKSAAGIGTLLQDGLGDTIRVSLTEDPEKEIPVALAITEKYKSLNSQQSTVGSQQSAVGSDALSLSKCQQSADKNQKIEVNTNKFNFNPFSYNKRNTDTVMIIGGANHPVIILDFPQTGIADFSLLDNKPDYIYIGKENIQVSEIPLILDYQVWKQENNSVFPLLTIAEYLTSRVKSGSLNFVRITSQELSSTFITQLKQDKTVVLILESNTSDAIADQREVFFRLLESNCLTPVIIKRTYQSSDYSKLQLNASADFGSLLTDGFGNGIWINSITHDLEQLLKLSYGILQVTKTRITRTEFISCPTCGRTSYDIKKVLLEIKEKTSHLKGLKIAVMGCIVNGPGEMADADYGYVGTATGKVNLYQGKHLIKNNIESSVAVEELIMLIKETGKWKEKNC